MDLRMILTELGVRVCDEVSKGNTTTYDQSRFAGCV